METGNLVQYQRGDRYFSLQDARLIIHYFHGLWGKKNITRGYYNYIDLAPLDQIRSLPNVKGTTDDVGPTKKKKERLFQGKASFKLNLCILSVS